MCKCANCKRANMELQTVTVDAYSAQLCHLCAHIVEHQPERLQKLVQQQTFEEANQHMKQQHQLISSLIACGVFALVALGGYGMAEHLNVFASDTEQALTFLQLKQF